MKRVLVTGASGFIGQSLVRLLIKEGYFVRATSRSRPQMNNLDLKNSYEWQPFDFYEKAANYQKLIDSMELIIHLAAQVHIMGKSSKRVIEAYKKINTVSTKKLATEAAKKGIRRFIYMSTIKVNGDNSISNKDNGWNMIKGSDPTNPLDAYSISKYEAELSIICISEQSKMESVIIRPPLVYGPGVRANFFRLLNAIYRRYPLPLAVIDNLRSIIYVENLSHILLTCINHPEAAGKTYLVKDIDISTPDLITSIADTFGYRARLFPFPIPVLKIAGRITGKKSTIERLTGSLLIDDSEIRKDLNWSPPYSLSEGLKATTAWYLDQL